MHGYYCKYCGKPVERAIEGELVCYRCYGESEMTPAQREQEREIARLIAQDRHTQKGRVTQ